MAILIPKQQSIKPPCGSKSGWGNPFSIALAGAYAFNEGAGLTYNDAVRGASRLTGIASPTWVATPVGSGIQTVRGSAQYMEAFDSAGLVATNDLSVVWYGIKNETTTSFLSVYAVGKWNTGASPGTNEWVLLIGDGNTGTGDNIRFSVEIGSTDFGLTASQTLTIGKLHHVAAVRRGTTLYAYLDGKEDATTTGSVVGTINNVGRKFRIAYHDSLSSDALYTSCTTIMAAVWLRALSAQEIKFLAAYPFAMFQPVVQPGRPPFISTAIGIPPGTLTPRFVFFETGEYHLGA